MINHFTFAHSEAAVIVIQRFYYGTPAPATTLTVDDDIEQAHALSEEYVFGVS